MRVSLYRCDVHGYVQAAISYAIVNAAGELAPENLLCPVYCMGTGKNCCSNVLTGPHVGAVEDPPDVHTCHAGCPCHSGGQPIPDFIEAVDGAV